MFVMLSGSFILVNLSSQGLYLAQYLIQAFLVGTLLSDAQGNGKAHSKDGDGDDLEVPREVAGDEESKEKKTPMSIPLNTYQAKYILTHLLLVAHWCQLRILDYQK